MAAYTGQDGTMSIGGTSVAELRSFSIDQTNNTVEATVMGDDWKTYKTTQYEWSGTADIYMNSTSNNVSNISAITTGAEAALEAFPGGNTSTYDKLAGNIIVTGLSVSSSMDGIVEATVSFQGTGALTLTTVA